MHCSNKSNLEGLLILALLFLPLAVAATNDLSQHACELQDQMVEINAKIATLASEQQKTVNMINTLRTALNAAHQQINGLKNSGAVSFKPSVTTVAGVHRTANGRGIRKR